MTIQVCDHCREQLIPGMTFCWSCGASTSSPAKSQTVPQQPVRPVQKPPKTSLSRTRPKPTPKPPKPVAPPSPQGTSTPSNTSVKTNSSIQPVLPPTTLAQWSLNVGIASLFCCFLGVGILAIAMGSLALWDINRKNGAVGGRIHAILGIIFGSVSFIVFLWAQVV